MTKRGAFVISLDFELHWGVRDLYPVDGAYTPQLNGARTAIPKTLELFERYGIAATWATVGFLFAKDKTELEAFSPVQKPQYEDKNLDPYGEIIGANEAIDPLHYAGSLIEKIKNTPRQEIGTHTFSHYYALEPGQTAAAFAADLDSAKRIGAAYGIDIKSIIYPRNQLNPDYTQTMLDAGITVYRGNEPSWVYKASALGEQRLPQRAVRLADSYLPMTPHNLGDWDKLQEPSGLINVPSSRFLRPFNPKLAALEPLRLARIRDGMKLAAKTGRIFHLWWHPHNFGVQQDDNMTMLWQVLEAFKRYQKEYDMESLNMVEVAKRVS